ncbi:MAG: 4-alpha-glucanotransferase [Blautia sp.]|nr:4-alpha-glucanotransferase [Clostridia bacterium]MDY4694156.1 4-alpha-glucanotransferase [Blautia sp.]MDY5555387.1 4-alpha-glucanotransferase [Blautia sp.]
MEKNRRCGVLLPVSSLPSKYGIGCFSKSAYEFVDKLKEAGQCCWQILPLCPTSYGDSPYQSFSTFAGNPYFISLEDLIEEGVLTEEECDSMDFGDDPSDVDYAKLYKGRYKLLRKAYERSDISKNPDFVKFQQEEGYWLKDYALFMALKERFGGVTWSEWPQDIRLRWQYSLDYYRRECYFDIEFQEYMQFKFYEQWNKLKAYANKKGIQIIGDIPIYVAMDSADTWASPWLFKLDENNQPTQVAGCPPDGFSATGQLWGNPLYNWEVHRQSGFEWWIRRIAHCFKMYDVVRIDHFRGFDEYYAIPFGDTTAENGWWEKGPGMDLFHAISARLQKKDIIAEDLGFVTPSVEQLVRDSGYPNMKVIEFAFDERDTGNASSYLPHNYSNNCVVYTGTHDNETLAGWFQSITDKERLMVREYLNNFHSSDEEIYKDLICLAMESVADLCVIPMQDYLGLGNDCRTNKPSTIGINWRWRLKEGQFDEKLSKWMKKLAVTYGRVNKMPDEM